MRPFVKVLTMSCLVALAAAAGCAAPANSPGPNSPGSTSPEKTSNAEKVALLGGAKVDMDAAIKAALAKVPGRAVDTELHTKNGKTVWEIDVVSADNKVTEVDVDATTGAVIDSE